MSITEPVFEDVEVPKGTYIGWAEVGQVVTGRVVSYSPEGGRNFNDEACPQLVLELTADATNFKDKGATRETLPAGEFATITAGQANLARSIRTADPKPGDIIRITHDGTFKTGKGDGKSFKIQIARQAAVAPPVPSQDGDLL